jgi:hypothetical protein
LFFRGIWADQKKHLKQMLKCLLKAKESLTLYINP